MTWNDVLIEAVNIVFKVITMLVLPYLASQLAKQIENNRVKGLITKGEAFVKKSVDMVQQTFVEQLKKDGKFDAEAQQVAFKMAFDNWMKIASEDVKLALMDEVDDLNVWLDTMIEAQIKEKV